MAGTPGVIAEAMAVSIEHVRYALSTIEQPRDQPPGWLHQQRLPELLTREFFEREYLENRKTLDGINKEFGYGKTALARHAKRVGIELRSGRSATYIDPIWLEEQYVQRRRPFYDIAAEIGVGGMTVVLAARRHGIAARPTGLVSHSDYVTVHDDLAPDIRAAVEGQLRGWQRLRRFRDAMAYPTIKAARRASRARCSLTTQFNRLERDIGAQLFHRATTRDPMRPTERGAALLNDLRHPRVEALLEKYGQPPRGKRQVDENRR